MARVEISEGVVTQRGVPRAGIPVTITARATGTPATIYQAESGGATFPNPLVTDDNGQLNGWLDEGSYLLTASGATPVPYEALNADTRLGVGAAQRDTTPQIITANLANNAEDTGAITLPRTTRFMRVQADRACRIRVYSTAADRDLAGEVARAVGTADADNSGLIAEWNLPTAAPESSLVVRCNPQPVGSNMDVAVADTLYWRIQNKSGGASTVQVNFVTQKVE